MKSFNLSEWAVTHRAMVLFLILGSLLVGAFVIREGCCRSHTVVIGGPAIIASNRRESRDR